MAELVQARVDWDNSMLPLPMRGWQRIPVFPEPGWPAGRKGLQLAGAWRQFSTRRTDGMLLLDGDVVIDPLDLFHMKREIQEQPRLIHTAPAKIWPVGSPYDQWVWAHWAQHPSQEIDWDGVKWFSFCFTYLPRRLIESAVKAGLETWTYPVVDSKLSRHARALKIPVNVVAECWPKHAHF